MVRVQFEVEKNVPFILSDNLSEMTVRRYYLNERTDEEDCDAGYLLAHYVGELVESIVDSLEDDEEQIDEFKTHLITLVRLAGKD